MISRELPRTVLSASQCKALDRRAIEFLGVDGYQLMQRAAKASLDLIRLRWPQLRSISLWVGGGNNGGDGVVLARLAYELGWQVQLVVANDCIRTQAKGEASQAWNDLPVELEPEVFSQETRVEFELVVDALLGIGVKGTVRAPLDKMIESINAANRPVLSLDQPSGLDSDLGVPLGSCVRADVTLTFIANKLGWLTAQGPSYAGTRFWADLGVPDELYTEIDAFAVQTTASFVHKCLPRRLRDAHKGDFGVVAILGGNSGMGGSVIMAAEAALRAGAGRVVLLTRPEHLSAALARVPEVMTYPVSSPANCLPLLMNIDALVIGPGLGSDDWASEMVGLANHFKGPKVIDADALKFITNNTLLAVDKSICTPHPGEAARMLGISAADVQSDRVAALLNLQRRYKGVQVLKGAGTLCAFEGQISVCDLGNPGMATAGMGDILSGIIGALLAQGLCLADSAACGVWIHARAGDLAAARGERGLLATDLLEQIRAVVNDNEIDN